MCSAFIFGNPLAIDTIMRCSNYLFSFEVTTINILNENVIGKQYILNTSEQLGFDISVFERVEICVNASDVIIILKDSWIPQKSIDYICELSISQNKILLSLNWGYGGAQMHNDMINLMTSELSIFKMPTVLCISLGEVTQQLYFEMLLNNIFSEEDVEICQLFTLETNRLLYEIDSFGYLNKCVQNVINKSCCIDKGIRIYSLSIKNIGQLYDKIELLRDMEPDFCVVASDNKFIEASALKRTLQYGGNISLDVLIKLHFVNYNGNSVYCYEIVPIEWSTIDIEDVKLRGILRKKILTKMALPSSFVVY